MDKIQSAKLIRTLAHQYEGMVAAAEALEQIGSLEQAKAEADRAVGTAQRELAEIKVELTNAKADLTKAKAKAADIISDANEEVARITEEARSAVEQSLAEANAKAEAIVTDAMAEADEKVKERQELIQALEQNAEILRGTNSDLAGEARRLRQEVSELEAKLEASRASLRKMLG